jgi:HPt (histidine-containing phosphotransfer) domain-containing protein
VEGDRGLLGELVDIFRVEAPRLLVDLRRGLAAGDAGAVQATAHALKGCVGNFGDRAAVDAASTLERLGRNGALAEAATRMDELEREVERLKGGLVSMVEEATV